MNKSQLFDLLNKGKYNQANYQLVVVKSLIKSNNLTQTKDQLVEALVSENPQIESKYFKSGSCPVWKVLSKKSILLKNDDGFKLNILRANTNTRKEIIDFCDKIGDLKH